MCDQLMSSLEERRLYFGTNIRGVQSSRVQRHYRAIPLTLHRWHSAAYSSVVLQPVYPTSFQKAHAPSFINLKHGINS